jgi:hypothetical protein
MSLTLSTILAVSDHTAGANPGHAAGAEEHHKSETPFFIAGAVLVAFAIAISVVGFKKPDFPATESAARGIMAVSAALVGATLVAIVYVSA